MLWVFLQVFLAFGVAVFIVWWTFPKATKTTQAKASLPPAVEPAKDKPAGEA